uniref:Putative NHN endonuclease n=1 Tax=Escherichia virus LS3 TaxID=2743777 RepID=A0A7D5FSZ6_9CAUD
MTQAVNLTNVPTRSHCQSGEKYVQYQKSTGRWQLRIKRKSYGTFDTIAEAVALRDSL